MFQHLSRIIRSICFVLFGIFSLVYAQSPVCGNSNWADAEELAALEANSQAVQSWIDQNQVSETLARTQSSTRYTIPVVFYFYGRGDMQAIPSIAPSQPFKTIAWMMNEFPEAMALDQIAALNDVYEQMGVRFCLAKNDVFGNPIVAPSGPSTILATAQAPNEPGIIYIEEQNYGNPGDIDANSIPAVLSYLGVTTNLPTDRYLSIFVAENGPLFYGQSKSGNITGPVLPEGVFVNYNAIGRAPWATTGDVQNPTTKQQGKTLAHEIGHYLGLVHPSFNSACAATGPCELVGDFICDTPPVSVPGNTLCPTPNNCPGSTVTIDDNIMLAEKEDACMNLFTLGQMTLMESVIHFAGVNLVDLAHVETAGCNGETYRVNWASTSLSPDGLTWANAFPTLDDALAVAVDGDEIWVAQGTYQAIAGTAYALVDGVGVFGGFDGTESLRTQRDWSGNVTTLEGNGSYPHICEGMGLSTMTTLDGFRLFDGNASAGGTGDQGGALWLDNSSLGVQNCTFETNTAGTEGGAVFANGGYPSFTNCTFDDNHTSDAGGAISTRNCDLLVLDCRFFNNESTNGGAINQVGACNSHLVNSYFCSNMATSNGSCLNDVAEAADKDKPTVTIVNCTMTYNSGTEAVYHENPSLDHFYVVNSISWQNGGDFFTPAGSDLEIEYCLLEYGIPAGATGLAGILDVDPEWDEGCQDAGPPSTSPVVDAGLNGPVAQFYFDLLDGVRICNGDVDIGCHEYQAICKDCDEPVAEALAEAPTVYPNPGPGLFSIRYEGEREFDVRVFDVAGNLCWQGTSGWSEDRGIDLRGHPAGVYLIEMRTPDKVRHQKVVLMAK